MPSEFTMQQKIKVITKLTESILTTARKHLCQFATLKY